jgi:hypothetical protein
MAKLTKTRLNPHPYRGTGYFQKEFIGKKKLVNDISG